MPTKNQVERISTHKLTRKKHYIDNVLPKNNTIRVRFPLRRAVADLIIVAERGAQGECTLVRSLFYV